MPKKELTDAEYQSLVELNAQLWQCSIPLADYILKLGKRLQPLEAIADYEQQLRYSRD